MEARRAAERAGVDVGAVPVRRAAALLLAARNDSAAMLSELKAVRGAGAALRLRPSDLEAALLCCARAGAWRQARWLTRAALAEPARSTLGGATLALAACARGDGVAFGRRRRALARSVEAAARSAEGDVFGLPSADGDDPRVALWRGVCPSAVAWAPRVLESRLQALQGSASIGDARRAAAAAAAAETTAEDGAAPSPGSG